jgi:hypothetical protein
VATFDELRRRLEEGRFQLTRFDEGGGREMTAQDGSMFEVPASETPGPVTPEIRLLAPAEGMPPGLEVVGLRAVVSLSWERAGDGIRSRIEYR